jgi:YMGG-like Gly-zipper
MVLITMVSLLLKVNTIIMKQLFSLVILGSMLTGCHSGADKAAEIQLAKQKTIDSLNIIVAKQKIVDSMNLVKVINEKIVTHVVDRNTMVTTSAQPAKKKGWSHTAKGAVVGAGAGAITGAIVNNKNRGEGAVIGAVIGAGVGAGTGLIVDKSVKKKKKKAAAKSANK